MPYNPEDKLINKFDEALSVVEKSMRSVGGYLLQAIEEEAFRQGGETFAGNIVDLAGGSESSLPDPETFHVLQLQNPTAVKDIMKRLDIIQSEVHKREIAEIRKPSMRKYGRLLLDGIASMNLVPRHPRR